VEPHRKKTLGRWEAENLPNFRKYSIETRVFVSKIPVYECAAVAILGDFALFWAILSFFQKYARYQGVFNPSIIVNSHYFL